MSLGHAWKNAGADQTFLYSLYVHIKILVKAGVSLKSDSHV